MRRILMGLCVSVAALATGCNPSWQEALNLPSQSKSNCTVTLPAAQTQTGWVQMRATTNQANIPVNASVNWVWNNGGGRYQLNPTLWSNGPTGWQSVTGVYPSERYRMAPYAPWNSPASSVNMQTRVVDGNSTLLSTDSDCTLTW